MDRGAWLATYSPWGRKKSDTPEQMCDPHTTPPHTDYDPQIPSSAKHPSHLGLLCPCFKLTLKEDALPATSEGQSPQQYWRVCKSQ